MLRKLSSKRNSAAILCVSESTFVRGVKEFRYPQPVCYDGPHPKWDEADLLAWQKAAIEKQDRINAENWAKLSAELKASCTAPYVPTACHSEQPAAQNQE